MFDHCIYFNLVTLTRRISKIWQESFESLGLSPSNGYLLFAIAEGAATSQKDLSELLELDSSTVNRFVDRLVHKGLVVKSSQGKGGVLSVSPKGKKVHHNIKKTMDKLYLSMKKHFGEEEFNLFVNKIYSAKKSLEE